MVPFLDLRRQTGALRPELEAAVAAVLASGKLVLGPKLHEFESAFARHCGVSNAVGVASGTDAITLALRAVGVVPGDEVITAAFGCVPTVAAIENAGARPVLVDVDPETQTLDAAALSGAVSERTSAIVPVHLYGQCADMEPIVAFARSKGLAVIEDAAQAHGAQYRGRRAGSLGDAAAFSFYPTKNLGAAGDAGAVLTNDADVAARVRLARNYGQHERSVSTVRGINSRLDEIQAAVLLTKLPHLDGLIERRRRLAARYRDALAGAGIRVPDDAPGRRHVYHLFVVRTPERERLRAHALERGIETLVHYPRPIHEHPAYMDLAPGDHSLEASERLATEVLSLPLYPEMTDDEADEVAYAVLDAGDG